MFIKIANVREKPFSQLVNQKKVILKIEILSNYQIIEGFWQIDIRQLTKAANEDE